MPFQKFEHLRLSLKPVMLNDFYDYICYDSYYFAWNTDLWFLLKHCLIDPITVLPISTERSNKFPGTPYGRLEVG